MTDSPRHKVLSALRREGEISAEGLIKATPGLVPARVKDPGEWVRVELRWLKRLGLVEDCGNKPCTQVGLVKKHWRAIDKGEAS